MWDTDIGSVFKIWAHFRHSNHLIHVQPWLKSLFKYGVMPYEPYRAPKASDFQSTLTGEFRKKSKSDFQALRRTD